MSSSSDTSNHSLDIAIDFSDLDFQDLELGDVTVVQSSDQIGLPETGASCCSAVCSCSIIPI